MDGMPGEPPDACWNGIPAQISLILFWEGLGRRRRGYSGIHSPWFEQLQAAGCHLPYCVLYVRSMLVSTLYCVVILTRPRKSQVPNDEKERRWLQLNAYED